MIKNLFKNIFTAKKKCPYCGTKLRFPSNKGKLKITCPVCHNSFIIEFKRFPFVRWDKNLGMNANLKNMKFQIISLYKQNPVLVWLWGFIIIMVISMLFRLLFSGGAETTQPLTLPESNDLPV